MWNVLLHQDKVVSRTQADLSLLVAELQYHKASQSNLSKIQVTKKISFDNMATIVLITGCSSGIGKYTALEYANNPKFKVSLQLMNFKMIITTVCKYK